ncbi:sigma-70 family RNA polymerase sigma factor [Actinoplanes sp. NBRC 101535]|uniref:sigma-70 family RNA polymerase sigma factor n=1 Tax=Actinoplanes sp. NBRC 101535 TaxID=3032196 RepID=UPI0024A4F0B2|nr:sigma-70 family RNA polymerase sigma factor [Actinoplanes sp. NBRC 101535]GLY05012.1 RNA polymerase sigma factor [Actinoplanes sp. NBRC 101535]
MEGEPFTRCLDVLVDDAERAGGISWSDVVRVAAARGLADEVANLLAALNDLDVDVVGVPSGVRLATGHDDKNVSGSLPALMRVHRILRPEQEVTLGQRIQAGIGTASRCFIERRPPRTDEQAIIADGESARNDLIVANVRLVVSMVRRYVYRAGDLDFDDLVQEGTRGLYRAAIKYDPEKGYKFSTYATWWIRQHVERAIDDTGAMIRVPVHLCMEIRRIQHYARDFEVRNGRSPTLAELATGVEQDPGRVQAMLDAVAPVARLDAPVGEDDGGSATLADYVLSDQEPGPEDRVIDQLVAQALIRRLEVVLDPRSMRIVEGRFGLGGGEERTLEYLGAELGITRERVRQIEKKIFQILRSDKEVRTLAETVLGGVA